MSYRRVGPFAANYMRHKHAMVNGLPLRAPKRILGATTRSMIVRRNNAMTFNQLRLTTYNYRYMTMGRNWRGQSILKFRKVYGYEGAFNRYSNIPGQVDVLAHRGFKFEISRRRIVAASMVGAAATGAIAYSVHRHRANQHRHVPPHLTHQQRVLAAQKRRRVAGRFA